MVNVSRVMNKERQKILMKLMHEPVLTFNELWNKEGTSNSFSYHIKVLEEDRLIEKTEEGYKLTHEGKKYSGYIEGETGEKAKAPIVAVFIVVLDGDKALMQKRTKEPFYDYWGFVGGKLKFDQYILECAKEELKQETGLECDLELKGLFSSKTYNNKDLSFNHQAFVIKATNPGGKLIKKTREGTNEWIDIKDMDKLKTFPNAPNSLDIALSDSFRWVEADRFQEDDVFKEMKVLKDKEF